MRVCAVLFVLADLRGGFELTRGRVFPNEAAFNSWCRLNLRDAQHGLCLSDLDLCAFRWDQGRLALAEVKTRGGTLPFAQKDLLHVLDQLLAAGAAAGPVETARGRRTVDYRGLYLVQLSGTTPENSEQILVNGAPVTKDQLARLLSLEEGDAHEHKHAS